jgi:hypothetical protein
MATTVHDPVTWTLTRLPQRAHLNTKARLIISALWVAKGPLIKILKSILASSRTTSTKLSTIIVAGNAHFLRRTRLATESDNFRAS